MTITQAQVRQAAPTSTGTQNFTVASFGTPKAAIVRMTTAEADGTVAAHARMSIGFTDTTDALVVCTSDDDAAVSTVAHTRADSVGDAIVLSCTGAGTVEWAADFTATVTDGIQITWTTVQVSNPPLVTVTLIGGTSLSAKLVEGVPQVTENLVTTVTGVGFEPEIVFCVGGTASFTSGSLSEANMSFGIVTNDGRGNVRQRGYAYMADHGATSADNGHILTRESAIVVCPDTGAADASQSLENFTSDGFDMRTLDSGDDYLACGFLCLNLGDLKRYHIVDVQYPGSTGNFSITGVGFKPGFIFGLTTNRTMFSYDQGPLDGYSFGLCAADHLTTEFCDGIASEDNSATMDTQSVSNDQFLDIYSDDGTAALQGTLTSLDTDGFTVNLTTATADYRGFYLCIEETEGTTPTNSFVAVLDDDDHAGLTLDADFIDPIDGTVALSLTSLTQVSGRDGMYYKAIDTSLANGRYYVDVSNQSTGEIYQTVEVDWDKTTAVLTVLDRVSYWLVGTGTTPPTASAIADEVETRWIGPFISEEFTTDASGQTTTLVKTTATPSSNQYAGSTIVVRDGVTGGYREARVISNNAGGDFTVDAMPAAAATSQTGWVMSRLAPGFDVLTADLADYTTAGTVSKAIADIETDTGTTLDGKLDTIDTNVDAILVDTGTTLDGKIDVIDGIVDAILVDTDTTLPATLSGMETKIDTVDTNVDAVLVDTGTTLDGKLDTIDTNVDAILVDTGTTLPATLTTIESKIDTVDTTADAILVDTGTTIPAQITSEINDVQTDISNLNDPTAAAVAIEVWDALQSAHVTAGSFGEIATEIAAILVDTGTTLDGKLDTIDTNVDAILVDTGTTIPATLTSIEGKVDTVDGVVDSILLDTAEIGTAGAGLTDLGGMSTTMKGQVNLEVDTALTDYDAVVPADLPTNFSDLAISATTGRVTVGTIAADSVTASALAADAATEIADAVLGSTVEGSISVVQALRGTIAVLFGELAGAATTTITIRDASDTKTRVTATVDGDGNRSALTLDLT